MSAGTLKLTNGSTAVTGTGTTFTDDMTVADVVVVTVGGTVYSLAVDSVTSDTALVLSLPFTGPTTTGVAWQAVPRKTMLRVTAELNKQVTEALRLANENAINWQAVLSSPDTVNVLLPDGTTLTGFSWRKINDLLNALDVDHLDATASQIHTDAQQVATDKPIIVQAKTDAIAAKTAAVNAKGDAETAKTASETAQGKSEAAQAKSETAQAAAEAAASSVHPENLLHKDQNLDDLADKSVARGHLDVYSKSETYGKTEVYGKTETYSKIEIDDKNTATNARIGSAVIDAGSLTGNNQVVTLTNPYGANTPVSVTAEIQYNGVWCDVGWIYSSAGTFGVRAMYVEGQGIVVKTGSALSSIPNNNGHILPTPDNYKGPANCRVLVRKISS